MNINTNHLVSITEANQNFSKVARLVDESGAVVILKTMFPVIWLWSFRQLNRSSLLLMRMSCPFPGA